jgi:hypothetical protein
MIIVKIKEFEKEYCQDILAKAKKIKIFEPDYDYPYDSIIEGPSGEPIRIVYSADAEIPVIDILSLEEDEFRKFYPSDDSLRIYKQYLEGFKIIEGEEVLFALRNEILKYKQRMESFQVTELEGIL